MIIVSNTSPISNLAAIGQLVLLQQLYSNVIIPPAVYQEILDSGATDPGTLDLKRGRYAEFSPSRVRKSIYRPFCYQYLYPGKLFNKEVALFFQIFPTSDTEKENRVICLTDIGSEKPFMTLVSDKIADLHLSSAGCGTQCFPFYTYDEDGTNLPCFPLTPHN